MHLLAEKKRWLEAHCKNAQPAAQGDWAELRECSGKTLQ